MLFLSHSSKDKKIARTLAHDLKEEGFQVWIDEWEIRVGECIVTGIEKALMDCRFVILALSSHSVDSGWVDRERKGIYWQEVEEGRVRVLPVLLEKCTIPLILRSKKYADLSEDYNAGFQNLVGALRGYISDESSADFYAYAPVISQQLILDPLVTFRNEHWDKFDAFVGSLTGSRRFEVQKLNSLSYLSKWGLTVSQLRKELEILGFPSSEDSDDFTHDLADTIEKFQKTHCMRHVDGVFGELTYRQMFELRKNTK